LYQFRRMCRVIKNDKMVILDNMENKNLSKNESLSTKEMTMISGGCGGEDYICSEQRIIAMAIAAISAL